MTAEQILGIAKTAVDMLNGSAAPPAPAAPAAPAFDVADEEYLTGAQVKRLLAAQRGAPDADPGVQMAADANLAFVRREFASDFSKWSGEIDALIARVPANMRTIDNLTRVVKMVRSDHVEEIAAERAQQLATTLAPTIRPTGGGSASAPVSPEYSLESEKIPAEWKERARAAKITEDTVRQFCYANGMTVEAFYKQFDTPANAIIGDVSQKRNA